MSTERSFIAEQLLLQFPGLRPALLGLWARWQKAQRLPRSYSCLADAPTLEGLARLFSARFVMPLGDGRARVNLGGFLRARPGASAELESLLSSIGGPAALGTGAQRALLEELESGLSRLVTEAESAVSKAFLHAALRELGSATSDWGERASAGARPAIELARQVIACLDALPRLRETLRIQNFSARVLGSSKLLRPGSDLLETLGAALVDHHPRAREWLDEQGVPPHRSTEVQAVLDMFGVYQDEAAASVLCFGPLRYEKRGQPFDQVARHAALGESSRLIMQQLRDVRWCQPEARRVTSFENLTPYLDYVDACVSRSIRDEIVLCASGQASWAVVAVLSGLARFELSFRHAGDLDRAGVLILRSLRRRSGAKLAPLMMDAPTLRRFLGRAQALAQGEQVRLAQRIQADAPDALCRPLLEAVLEHGVWLEQEAFTEDCLDEMLA